MFFPLTQRKDEVFCYVKIGRKRVGSKSFSFFFEVKQKFLRHETFVSLRRNFCFKRWKCEETVVRQKQNSCTLE